VPLRLESIRLQHVPGNDV